MLLISKIEKKKKKREKKGGLGYLKASKSYQCGEEEEERELVVIMKTEEVREKQKAARRKRRMRELKRRSLCTVTVEWKWDAAWWGVPDGVEKLLLRRRGDEFSPLRRAWGDRMLLPVVVVVVEEDVDHSFFYSFTCGGGNDLKLFFIGCGSCESRGRTKGSWGKGKMRGKVWYKKRKHRTDDGDKWERARERERERGH